MGKFYCESCGYKVDAKSSPPKNCPYCGKEDLKKEKSAEELVNETQ